MFPIRHNNYDNTGVTVELRELVENGVDIWNFAYPSYYSGEQKKAFEQKVIDHYMFRQIGQETVGRWLHYFRTRIREIMPYYIQMYKSVELMEAQEDPFEAYNLREEYTEERKNTGSYTGETSESSKRSDQSDSTRKHSDTPQGSISNLEKFMSEATLENAEVSSSGSSSGTSGGSSEDNGSVKYTLTRKGNIGVQPLGKEVQALRDSYINVDQMIIDELNDLFLLVY